MSKVLFVLLLLAFDNAKAQENYDQQLEKLAKDIVAYFKAYDQKIKIGVTNFKYNGQQTELSKSVSEDLVNELLILNKVELKFIIVDEAKWSSVKEIKDADDDMEKLLMIGKMNIVDYVCDGKISDIENGYKISIRLYDSKEGNLLMALKIAFSKSPDKLNDEKPNLKTVVHVEDKNEKNVEQEEQPEKQPKEKKKREGTFWKTLGGIAATSMQQVVTTTIDQQVSKIGNKQGNTNETTTNNTNGPGTNNTTNNGNDNNNTNDNIVTTNKGAGSNALTSKNSNNETDECKSYINFINSTESTIQVRVYKRNPRTGYSGVSSEVFSFTIAAGKSKKQKVVKDFLFYYLATNNVGINLKGELKDWNGTFQVEDCDTVDEEIE